MTSPEKGEDRITKNYEKQKENLSNASTRWSAITENKNQGKKKRAGSKLGTRGKIPRLRKQNRQKSPEKEKKNLRNHGDKGKKKNHPEG